MSATASASVVGAKADVVSFSARGSAGEGWGKRVGMRVKPLSFGKKRILRPRSSFCGSGTAGPSVRGPRGSPAPRPRPRAPHQPLRAGRGGRHPAPVKTQRAGERNMALGSSMCKIRKELQ